MNLIRKIQLELWVALGALAALTTIGTVVYHMLEGWSWTASFYFAVTTLSTVGYGDMYPSTDASRIFTSFYIIAGVGIGFASLGVLGTTYLSATRKQIEKRNEKD